MSDYEILCQSYINFIESVQNMRNLQKTTTAKNEAALNASQTAVDIMAASKLLELKNG